ncbi:hypothetical protein SMSP2_02353 [Limihaloglobus sulfuriphilus]|uniref:Uncharacterized protein n=1 Tax=Limihaloglobus sulfuriphilus TaxID=1851148 RepID=A0A1Q2MH46_9BACT|nr:hypothetical protein [Limihaloglobus sulfuriphilus]AQQ71974.1 hypothetical protein SMSP2_02353 [Limihaloglobus sulfuriphilus]
MTKRIKLTPLFVVFLFLAVSGLNTLYGGELDPMSAKLLSGKTVQADFGFPPYKDRSASSIAEEITANGYDGVYYFVCADSTVRKDIIAELQKREIPVAVMLIATGAYLPANERPEGWEKWKMEFTSDVMDSYQFMSFVHKDYAEWMKHRVVRLINDCGFDGFTFAEAMYPIADGLERENVLYGDISPAFRQAFKKDTGNSVFPEFVDTAKANYYKKIPDVYNDLVEYRIKTVNDFYDEVVNGQGGVREKCPGKFVATWTLGISLPQGLEKLREWEGNDIPSMIRRVKPDMHFIQTHAPDWTNPQLKPDYPGTYKPFFDAVKQTDPQMPVGFQADFVSHEDIRRSPQWVKRFYEVCGRMDIDSTTYYVFGLRWNVYHEPPRLCSVKQIWKDTLVLSFDQRISKDCERIVAGRKMITDDKGTQYSVKDAAVDGSLLKLVLDKDICGAKEAKVLLEGIKDDPAYRFERQGPWQPMPKGETNVIEKGVCLTLPVE